MARSLVAPTVVVSLLAAGPAWSFAAVQAPPAESAPKAVRTAPAERGTLAVVIERSGRVEPVRSESVRLELESFGGPVSVKDVLRRSGPVKAGEPILELEGKDFERGLEDLRTQHAEATRRLEMQREERAMQARQAVAGVERATVAAELAQQALELHRDYEAAKALEMSDLSLKSSLDGLQDSRDELSQLEKMYSGTSLQSETKDIVLERARRGVERGSVYARYAKRDNEIFKAIRAPNDARRVQDQAKQSSLDLESARLQQRLGEIRAELDLAQSERGLRDLGRRLERMEGDAKRLRVASPADGFLVVKVREPGDQLQPRQEVLEVVDLGRLRVRGTLSADAIRFVKPGDSVRVWFPSRPEVRAEAVIDEIVSVGSPEGEGASFPFVATVRSADASVLPGIEARVLVRGSLEDRVLVPSKAIKQDKGRFTVRVAADGKDSEREVRVGVSDGTRTEVVEGIAAGEQVVVPDA
jgi:multidrug resistance efflux pump